MLITVMSLYGIHGYMKAGDTAIEIWADYKQSIKTNGYYCDIESMIIFTMDNYLSSEKKNTTLSGWS